MEGPPGTLGCWRGEHAPGSDAVPVPHRSNKGAVGNCVTGMVHNHYTPSGQAPPPKSSNRPAPSLK